MRQLLYEEITVKIRQAAYDVHHYFGNGFLEKVYENALAYKLLQSGLECKQQTPLKVYFEKNVIVGEYYADIIVEDKIILELKAIENLDRIHFAQVKNYLKATKFKLGILINFGKSILEFKRIIL